MNLVSILYLNFCWHFSVQNFDHILIVLQRGSTFGKTQQSKVFGLPCNALLQSIIATIKFALGQREIQFESGPMQFLLKLIVQQEAEGLSGNRSFSAMKWNWNVPFPVWPQALKSLFVKNKLCRHWTTPIGVTQTCVALRRSLVLLADCDAPDGYHRGMVTELNRVLWYSVCFWKQKSWERAQKAP